MAMVTMILRSSNIVQVDNPYFNQATLTISKLIIFNPTVRTRQTSSQSYHATKRKPPIAVYLGELLQSQTRKLDSVSKMCHLLQIACLIFL